MSILKRNLSKKKEDDYVKRIKILEEENLRLKTQIKSTQQNGPQNLMVSTWSYKVGSSRLTFNAPLQANFSSTQGFMEKLEKELHAFSNQIATKSLSLLEKEICLQTQEQNLHFIAKGRIHPINSDLIEGVILPVDEHIKAFFKTQYNIHQLLDISQKGIGFFEFLPERKGEKADIKILDMNEFGARILNHEREQLIGQTFSSYFGEMDKDWMNMVAESIREKKEVIYERPSKKFKKVLRICINPVRSPFFSMVFEDISQYDSNRSELGLYKHYFESVLKNLPVAVYAKDGQTFKHTLSNNAFDQLMNLIPTELIGRDDYDLFSKEDADYYRQLDQEIISEKKKIEFETCFQQKNGKLKHLKVSKLPIRLNQHELSIIGIVEDVTEIRAYQKELKERESHLENAEKMARLARWHYSFTDQSLNYTNSFIEIHGLEKFYPVNELLNLIYEEDVLSIRKLIVQSLEQKKESVEFLYRLTNNYGKTKHLYAKGLIERNALGEAERINGTVQDISTLRQFENALAKSEDRFQTLFNAAPFGIAIIDSRGLSRSFNKTVRNLFRLENEDSCFQLFNYTHEIDTEQIKQKYAGLFEEKESAFKYKTRFVLKDKVIVWTSVTVTAIKSYAGKTRFAFTIFDDITDIVSTEIQLRESEQILRNILIAIPDKIFRLNNTFEIIDYYNDKHSFTSNKPLLGFKLCDIYQTDEQKFSEVLTEVLCTGIYKTFSFKTTKKNKSTYYEARIIRSGNEELIVVVRNVTTKVNFEKTIIKSEEKYRSLTENMLDSLIRYDRYGKHIYLNKAALAFYGLPKEEILGKNNAELGLEGEICSYWDSIIGYVIESKKPHQTQFEWNSPVGWRAFDWRLTPEFDDDGMVISVLSFTRDITSTILTQKELLKAKEQAEESDRLKTSFLANMSHEIRTPMNAIVGFSNLIKDTSIEEKDLHEYLDIIYRSSNQLLGIIDDILDISKIESGLVAVLNEEFNLHTMLIDLQKTFVNQFLAKKIKLHLNKAFNKDVVVFADQRKLRQIFTNLLSNALKFTQKGKVEFGYRVRNNCFHFFVNDTGIGIPKEKQEIIFERFRRVNETYTRDFGGTGLGLSIAKNFVAILGGSIHVESEPGKGACFSFSFPLEIKTNAPYPKKTNPIQEHYNWNGKSIVIVEDEHSNFILLEKIIQPTRAVIIHFSRGMDAIQYLKSNQKPDLVLLDIQLPDIAGWEVAKEMLILKPGIPIIAQTANVMEKDKQKAIQSGCIDFIAKPIKSDDLLVKLNIYLFRN